MKARLILLAYLLLSNMKSSVVLLKLLQIALGNSANWKVEESVDWKEVIGLAQKQGGLAIAFDALEKENVKLRDRVLGDILHPEFQAEEPPMEKRFAHGIVSTKRLWVNRWKHRMVFDESILSTFWHYAIYRMTH